eukprot:694237-Pelagomonas_calceolata.AAC.1
MSLQRSACCRCAASNSIAKKNYACAVKTLPTSIKERRIPRAEVPCNPCTKRNKRKKSMEIRRVTSSSPCLLCAW